MRFRASISNVSTFIRILQSIEKLYPKLYIKLAPTEIQLIATTPTTDSGVQVWSSIKIDTLFTDYRIQSNAENIICIALSPEALASALKSASPGGLDDLPTLKLAKKLDLAVLSLEVSCLGEATGARVSVVHDIRIDVLKAMELGRLKEPLCPDPDVHIILPALPKLKTVIERLRPMTDVVKVKANMKGGFAVEIRTEGVRLETEWTGCENPKMKRQNEDGETVTSQDDPDEEETDPERMASVLVSVKSFLKFLNCHVVSTTTIACICQNHCIIFYVYIGEAHEAGGVLTFYVPSIVDDEMT